MQDWLGVVQTKLAIMAATFPSNAPRGAGRSQYRFPALQFKHLPSGLEPIRRTSWWINSDDIGSRTTERLELGSKKDSTKIQ